MNIATTYSPTISARQNLQAASAPQASVEVAQSTPSESFVPSSKSQTPLALKAGKWLLAGAAAAGAGALGWYAGTHTGLAAGAAAAGIGGLTGAIGLGCLGLMADIGSLGGSNKTATLGATGLVLGGIAGGASTLLGGHPLVGGTLALVGGAAAFGLTAAATNILAK